MKQIRTQDAVGHVLCHDITQIIKDVKKDTAFRKGHIIREEDIPLLLSLGKDSLYVWEAKEGMIHENDAAQFLYEMCVGMNEKQYMSPSKVKEGKIDISANCDGILMVNTSKLNNINALGGIMIATRHGRFTVRKGDKLAGTRIIPLVIKEEKLAEAKALCEGEPIITLKPFIRKKVGIITTGNEVYHKRIEDRFTPVLINKIHEFGGSVCDHVILDDNPTKITEAIVDMIQKGADIVLCSGGMSVDPDDRTPLAIKNTGGQIVTYGAPVLPGAMFMLAYAGDVPIMGLPGCVMYSKRTIFDLVLPLAMADVKVEAEDLNVLGQGGLCLNCESCIFPNCGFGKGR